MLKYMHSCISGALSATIRSARVKSPRISSAAAPNFFFSWSSREKPFTTRIPRTFSSMDSFSRSYLRNTERKAGIAFLAIMSSPKTSTGMMITKEVASAPPIMNAMIIEKISISGARTAVRIVIIYASCAFDTSVVRRVTSDEDEKRSIFANEKRCMLANMSLRIFFAKPADASALVLPAIAPAQSEQSASTMSRPPRESIKRMSVPC